MITLRNTAIAIVFILSPVAAYSTPSILGDEVTVSYEFPAIGTPQCGLADVKTTTVTADSSDAVTVLDCLSPFINLTVDMNALGFESLWETTVNASFFGLFDGLVISGLDWNPLSPSNFLIETDLPGWSDARASFTANSMAFNYSGNDPLPVGNYFFNVQAVPEPSTLALFGIGLLGMAFLRRKQTTKYQRSQFA